MNTRPDTLIPPVLGIARPHPKALAGNPPSAQNDGKISKELKQKILQRDNDTCRCCGFVAKKYQEIHFRDDNRFNLSEDNLITTCAFCHQCFNLQNVGRQRSGALIWLPEIPQDTLHHIARAIYIARISQGPVAEVARNMYDMLLGRKEQAAQRLGTNDPTVLAMVLKDYLPYKAYHFRAKKLDGIRLMPLDRRIRNEANGLEFNQFPQFLAYWRSKDGPFGSMPPPQWVNVYQEIARPKAA